MPDPKDLVCGNCYFMDKGAQMSVCTRYPPTVFMFFQAPTVQGGQPSPMFATQHPIVRDEQTCGEHARELEDTP